MNTYNIYKRRSGGKYSDFLDPTKLYASLVDDPESRIIAPNVLIHIENSTININDVRIDLEGSRVKVGPGMRIKKMYYVKDGSHGEESNECDNNTEADDPIEEGEEDDIMPYPIEGISEKDFTLEYDEDED